MATQDVEKEKRLVVALVNGDESAFCELYALYKDRLLFFALRFVKSPEIAEDVFQDAFTSLWQSRGFLNPNAPFAPYIYTVVKNRILNLLSHIDKEQELHEAILSGSIGSASEAEDQAVDADLDNLLDKALESLTPQQRRVFEMSRKEMIPHKEIAVRLGISVYTVQQHISSSLKVIRAFLSKYAEIYMWLF